MLASIVLTIDGNQYDFAVVRLHGDGKADVLPDLDSDPATITFQTDRFSVYAVIYGPKGSFKTSGKDRVPKTGDSTIPVLPIAAAGAACGAAEFGDRFLILSTCAYHVEDGRFVVVAKETL